MTLPFIDSDALLFRFSNPELLWLLLLLPLLAMLKGRQGAAAALRFPATALARQIAAFVRSSPGGFVVKLRMLALTLLILALARPQFGSGISELEASGIDIVLAVDLSTSMYAHDFEIEGERTDRLTVVKKVMEDFIEKRPNDRIGIMAFAGAPYLVSPLTLNHQWLRQNLKRLEIGLIEDGTAIGTAIGASVNRLRSQKAKSRIIILLTDGVNNRGNISPAAAAEAANAYNIKIYTVGAGNEGKVPMPVLDRYTGLPRRDRNGRMSLQWGDSHIDLQSLREIADITHGNFYHATDTESLAQIYDEIDRLEKTDVKLNYRAAFADVFLWPAAGGLLILALELLLANTRYRRLP